MKNNKGLTMISLVITVVIMLIMAAVAINSAVGDNGVITEAQKSKYLAELSSYKEQLQVFIDERIVEDPEFDPETLNAADTMLFYNTKEAGDTSGNINSVIENINTEYFSSLEIIKGELYLSTQDPQIADMAKTLGIMVSPFNIVDGVLLSTDGNLLIMDEYGSLTIPGSVREIGGGAFANVSGLKTIIIPGSCKKIGANAFAYNSTIERAVLEEGVEEIGSNAFGFSSNLQNVELPSTLKVISSQAFYSCSKLKTINENNTIPDGITTLSANVFVGTALENLTLPSTLKTIQGDACRGMKKLQSLTIPASVTSIASNVFTDCTNLEEIILIGNTKYRFEEKILFDNSDNILYIAPSKLAGTDEFVIPDNIKNFTYALQNHSSIKKLVIGANLQSVTMSQGTYLNPGITTVTVDPNNEYIGNDTTNKMLYYKKGTNAGTMFFCYAKGKATIDSFPAEVDKTGMVCFIGARDTTKVIIPESSNIKTLGYMTFTNAAKGISVDIPKTVTKIDSMFKYSNKTGTVTIAADNPNYEIIDGVIYTKGTNRELVTVAHLISGHFDIPEGVTALQGMAFHNQYNMTTVSIPDSLKNLNSSFGYCSSLKEITIPITVTNISSGCFANCKNLEKIYLEDRSEGSLAGAPWGAPVGNRALVWNH